jgi:putative ABC transport system substrate-binding protein
MAIYVARRKLLATLLGGAAAWPLATRAQQPAMPLIGFLSSVSASVTSKRISSFGQGLGDTGYTVGRDVTVEQGSRPDGSVETGPSG